MKKKQPRISPPGTETLKQFRARRAAAMFQCKGCNWTDRAAGVPNCVLPRCVVGDMETKSKAPSA